MDELRKKLCDELKEYGKKEINAGTLQVIDTLAHAIKNIDKIIETNGYSSRHSHNSMVDSLKRLMEESPDEMTRHEFQRFISKMETM